MRYLLLMLIILLLSISLCSADTDIIGEDGSWTNFTLDNMTTNPRNLTAGFSADFFNRTNSTDMNANTGKTKWWEDTAGGNIKNNAAYGQDGYSTWNDLNSSGSDYNITFIIVSIDGTESSEENIICYFYRQSSSDDWNGNGYMINFYPKSNNIYYRIYISNSLYIIEDLGLTVNVGDIFTIDTSTVSSGLKIYRNGILHHTFPSNNTYSSGFVGFSPPVENIYGVDNYFVTKSLSGNATSSIRDATVNYNLSQISWNGNKDSGITVKLYVNTSSDNSSFTGRTLVEGDAQSGTLYSVAGGNQQRYYVVEAEYIAVGGNSTFEIDTVRAITIVSGAVAPSITSYAPTTLNSTYENVASTYNATIDQSNSNNEWLINGTRKEWDNGTASPAYTNSTWGNGTYNLTLISHNNSDNSLIDSQIWIVTVLLNSVDITYRQLNYSNLTANVLVDISNKTAGLQTINIPHIGNLSNTYCYVYPNGTAAMACVVCTGEGDTIWFNGSESLFPELDGNYINETLPMSYTPSAPVTLTNITANFYVNYSWQKTGSVLIDSWNVFQNGTWTNGTTSNWSNDNIARHGTSTIIVFAYNSTGNGNVSTSSVTDAVTLVNNAITITNLSTNYAINETSTLYFYADYTDLDGDTPTFTCNQSNITFDQSTGTGSWTTHGSNNGTYNIDIGANDHYGSTDNFTIRIVVNNTVYLPTVTLLSQTPSELYQNSTGYVNISYGVSHDSSGLNNARIAFIYRNYDPDCACSNHSIRPPNNSVATVWDLDGRILRGANRNETLNFEANATITEGNSYTWSGLDYNSTRLTVVPVNGTYTKVYINGTVHDVMPQMWFLDRSDLQEAAKTTIAIHKNQDVLVKFWNLEIFKNNTDFLGVGYTDTALNANPALWPVDANPVNVYYLNSSYDPATGGDPLTSGFAVYMLSLNASEWTNHVYEPHANSSYVRGFINNTLLEQYIKTDEISYLFYTSETSQSKGFLINVTDVASSTNLGFNETNVMWAGSSAPYTQQLSTPNIWFSFMKNNITFDHKLFVADTLNKWGNSTLSSTVIGKAFFPPTKSTFHSFHNGFTDYDMNGTYSGTFDIQVGAGSDPDGGNTTQNVTLHYGNGTYTSTLANTICNASCIFMNISFNSTPYYSIHNYTLKVVATDDEDETATTWLGVNFTLSNSAPTLTGIPNVATNPNVNTTFDISLYASDPESDTLTYSVEIHNQSSKVNITVNTTTGLATFGIKEQNWTGSANVTFRVTDTHGAYDNDTIIFRVSEQIGVTISNIQTSVNCDSVSITWTNGDNVSYVRLYDEVDWQNVTSPASRTGLSESTNYAYTLTPYDITGYAYTSSPVTFTTTLCTTPSDGYTGGTGSGGGTASGSGTSDEPSTNVKCRETGRIRNLKDGFTSYYTTKNSDCLNVIKVSFKPTQNSPEQPILIEGLYNTSKQINVNPPETTIANFNLYVGLFGYDSKTTDEKILFKVSKNTISEQNLSANSVTLYKFTGKWIPLPTKAVSTGTDCYVYESFTGATYGKFAIVAEEDISKREKLLTEIVENLKTIPSDIIVISSSITDKFSLFITNILENIVNKIDPFKVSISSLDNTFFKEIIPILFISLVIFGGMFYFKGDENTIKNILIVIILLVIVYLVQKSVIFEITNTLIDILVSSGIYISISLFLSYIINNIFTKK